MLARRRLAGLAPLASMVAALAAASAAHAQVSASATLASDFRLRGFSLTERRPALTLSGAFDHRSGLYGGASVVGHDPKNRGARLLGHTEYLGYAVRTERGLNLDVGVANVDFELYRDRVYPLNYKQVYVGVARDSLSARLSYSPDFPRDGVDSLYMDLNGAVRPAEDWRLTGHFGATHRLGGAALDGDRNRYDLRIGATRTLGRVELQAAYTAILNRPDPHSNRTRPGVQVGMSVFF